MSHLPIVQGLSLREQRVDTKLEPTTVIEAHKRELDRSLRPEHLRLAIE